MKCPNCGVYLDEGEHFCPICGYSFKKNKKKNFPFLNSESDLPKRPFSKTEDTVRWQKTFSRSNEKHSKHTARSYRWVGWLMFIYALASFIFGLLHN